MAAGGVRQRRQRGGAPDYRQWRAPHLAELATVSGLLCTPLDVLAHMLPLGHAEVGDLIVVFQSGAYGLSASPSAFLHHPAALEVLV